MLANRIGMDPPSVDATPLWKIGALMRHLAREDTKAEENDLRAQFEAFKRGEGPDPRLHPADQERQRQEMGL